MRKLFRKKAFTLVEVLIATAITGLLIAAVMALFGPVRNLIDELDGNVNVNNTTDMIQSFLHTRLNRATIYDIDLYDSEHESMNYNESGSIGGRVESMRIGADPSINTYCIMLKYVDGGYVVYDLGRVNSGQEYDNVYSDLENCRLFNEEYYSGANYRFTFETKVNPKNDSEWWCTFKMTPYDDQGVLLLETRASVFKMLNAPSQPTCDSKLADEKYITEVADGDTPPTIAIVYNIKDYSDPNYAPEEV